MASVFSVLFSMLKAPGSDLAPPPRLKPLFHTSSLSEERQGNTLCQKAHYLTCGILKVLKVGWLSQNYLGVREGAGQEACMLQSPGILSSRGPARGALYSETAPPCQRSEGPTLSCPTWNNWSGRASGPRGFPPPKWAQCSQTTTIGMGQGEACSLSCCSVC